MNLWVFIGSLNRIGLGALHNRREHFSSNHIPDFTGWRSTDREEEHDMVCLRYADILSESAFRAMGKVVRCCGVGAILVA